MVNETVARRYAAAVFGLARDRNAVEAVGRALRQIRESIEADPAVLRFFVAPVVTRAEKIKVLSEAFARTDEIALHTLLLLVRKRREPLLRAIVEQYARLEVEARGAEPLEIISARPLEDGQAQALVERLARIYGKRFEPERRVDPSLIGGLRITMGDNRVDGTIAGRLDDLARNLLQTTGQMK
jgi:F-type H+-transporting ATPase subunit delta